MKLTLTILTATVLISSFCLSASANSQANFSQGSELSFKGSATIIEGGSNWLKGSGKAIITSIETVGKSSIIIVEGVSETGKVSAKISMASGARVSLTVGDSLTYVREDTGLLLKNPQGEIVAFVPNEHTRKQFHQKRHEWKTAL